MRGVRRLCSVLGLSEYTISNPDVWVPSPINTPQLFLKDRVNTSGALNININKYTLSLSSVTRATVQGEIKCNAFYVSSNEAPRSWIRHP